MGCKLNPASRDRLRCRGLPVLFAGQGEVQGVTDGADWYFWQTGQ